MSAHFLPTLAHAMTKSEKLIIAIFILLIAAFLLGALAPRKPRGDC
jgi:hypothetical protein